MRQNWSLVPLFWFFTACRRAPAAVFLNVAIFFALSIGWSAGNTALAGNDRVIVMLGDSLTAGLGLAVGEDLPGQLEKRLRGEGLAVRIINAGVSGDTSAGGLARLDWALADKPDMVIIALGGNDGLRAIPPAETRRNLAAIIEKLQARSIAVLLAGMKAPRNLGEAYAREFDALFPALARKYGIAFYPFLLEGVALSRDLNQPDGLHPNRRGVAIIAGKMAPKIKQVLESLPERVN